MQITASFYATREEIHDWIAAQVKRFPLHFALVRYRPKYELIALPDWARFLDKDRELTPSEVWINLRPINLRCSGQLESFEKNRGHLSLQLPETRPDGLREGKLGTTASDEDRLKVWRSVIRYFRARTTSGMWVQNPDSGDKGFYKNLRYSPAIAALHAEGLPLLPWAGGNRVFVADPSPGRV